MRMERRERREEIRIENVPEAKDFVESRHHTDECRQRVHGEERSEKRGWEEIWVESCGCHNTLCSERRGGTR